MRHKCIVVSWEIGQSVPIDKVVAAIKRIHWGHQSRLCPSVTPVPNAGHEQAVIVAPNQMSPEKAQKAWYRYVENAYWDAEEYEWVKI